MKFKVMSNSVEYKNGQYGFLCMASDLSGIRRYYARFKSKYKAYQIFKSLEKWDWGWYS